MRGWGADRHWGQGAGVAAVVLVLGAGLLLALDLDRDGDSAWTEWRVAGTSPWYADSDLDTLADGWERRVGLDPLQGDSEGDGVRDDEELRLGSDPLRSDTDGDGLSDRDEAGLGDCNGDGVGAIAQGDGDADGRLDALEAGPDRCVADADGDGVLDGAEGNERCVHAVDCDGDGLGDGNETADSGFDPLDPDSFGSGVSDSISFAFQRSGQAPGADADDDGIPDGWEGDDGLIVWGELRPQAGQRDLLVEYLRVQGPDSGRYQDLSFAPAYQAVADAVLRERGVRLRWLETVVNLPAESDPALLPSLEDPYYTTVLAKGRHVLNPYVTTVVMNPQHNQSQILHSGVAPIRGMLAAVDYGSHVAVEFQSTLGARLSIQPVIESMIRGGRQDLIQELGFDQGGFNGAGEMVLRSQADGYDVVWHASWFRTAPRIDRLQGNDTTFHAVGARVDQAAMADTILHELGHTLGLCHAHEPDCNAKYTFSERTGHAASTMSYAARTGTLHFLDSEWAIALAYVSCPPDAAVTLVAQGASADQLLQQKYGYANRDILSVDLRACNDLVPVPRSFATGQPPALSYATPEALAQPRHGSAGPAWTIGVAALAVLVAVGAGLAIGLRRQPGPPDGRT